MCYKKENLIKHRKINLTLFSTAEDRPRATELYCISFVTVASADANRVRQQFSPAADLCHYFYRNNVKLSQEEKVKVNR